MKELKRIYLQDLDSRKQAWYELLIYQIDNGYLVHKNSGAGERKLNSETWFRPSLTEADNKFSRIVKDKTNPDRKSPRHYKIVN